MLSNVCIPNELLFYVVGWFVKTLENYREILFPLVKADWENKFVKLK